MHFYLMFAVMNITAFLLLGLNLRFMFADVIYNKVAFWIVLFFFTQLYWIVRRFSSTNDVELPSWVFYGVSMIFGIFILAVFTMLFADIVLVVTKFITPLNFIFDFLKLHKLGMGVAIILLVMAQFAIGLYAANKPRVTHYTFKNPDVAQNFRIVQLADLHITTFTSRDRMERLVEKVNELKPDLIVITGDIIDNELKPYLDKNMKDIFINFKSNYGVYAVLGNHDYYGGDAEEAMVEFTASGMTVLRDTAVEIDDLGIVLAGRDDLHSGAYTLKPRMPLADIINGFDRDKPLIVLNHQPLEAEDAMRNNAFLELAGHTHNGQIFPVNIIVKYMYPIAWGVWSKNNYNLLVSCGTGTWGLPVRTSSYSEIVVIDIEK